MQAKLMDGSHYLPDTAIKGKMGEMFIQSCALRHGFKCQFHDGAGDYDSIDLTIYSRVRMSTAGLSRFQMDVQAKCHAKLERLGNGDYSYRLSEKNFVDLADEGVQAPRILVVVTTVDPREHRFNYSPPDLTLKLTGYWASLAGEQMNAAKSTKTIHIPKENLFNPESLFELMKLAGDRKPIPRRLR